MNLPTRRPSSSRAQKKAHPRRTTFRAAETVASSEPTPAPTVPPVIFHSGARFVLRETFAHNATYGAHRRRMEALTSFDHVLTELERLSKRLQRATKIDRTRSADAKQDGRRSRTKGTALYRRLCVAYDLHFRVAYAQRFLNSVAHFDASSSEKSRELARRGQSVVSDLLYRSDWRGQGRRPAQRSRPSIKQLDALRRVLSRQIQRIWRRCKHEDVSERQDALKNVLDELNLKSVAVPPEVLKRPPSRVVEFILSKHFGVRQVDTRPASGPNIELRYG